MTKHTPTPWKVVHDPSVSLSGQASHTVKVVDADGEPVALLGKGKDAKAAFIVRAVNAHEALLEAVKTAQHNYHAEGPCTEAHRCLYCQAIAKAEGRHE